MPILRDFERRLGGLVEGLFSKAFRSGVQPVEIAKLIMREMESGRSVGVSEVWAPNRFELSLSSEDAARYEQAEDAIASELRRVGPRESAAEHGWGLVGPPEVEFVVDENLKKGDLSCVASLVEGEDDGTGGGHASVVVREDGKERLVSLSSDVVTIGRLADCDVVLKDKGASRKHAQLKLRDGAWTLTDLGSTNGTRLNGQTVQARELSDGDTITIGTTVIESGRTDVLRGVGLVADTTTPFALSALKYGLFALLFLFIWRSMRWVVRGLSVAEEAAAQRGGRRPRDTAPTLPPGPSSLLMKGQADAKPRTVRLSASMTIGRAPECELRIDDTYASQQHARLFAKNNSWFVEDLGSTNGTFVNDQKLAAPAMLQAGDKVRVGQTIMELRR